MITNNRYNFSMAKAVELQDKAKTLKESQSYFDRSCSICPKAGFCIEDKCYLAQLYRSKQEVLKAEELTTSGNSKVNILTTRKYDRKGVAKRLITIAYKQTKAYSKELALDAASVYVELGDYESAYLTLEKNGFEREAEALKKVIKGDN